MKANIRTRRRGAVATAAAIALLAATALPAAASAASGASGASAREGRGDHGHVSHGNGLKQTNLAEYGKGGYNNYRIPALTVTNKGTLLAAFDGRPGMGDLPSNITSLLRRSTDGGKTWKPAQIVRSAPKPAGFGDPSLLVDRATGRIFDFYAAGVDQGFAGSKTGNDESDPDILQADYSYSDDDGRTWHSRRITSQIKDSAWGGMFASSGQGIQLTTGKHEGRLVQQYAIKMNGGVYAASAYSDDHGDTWTMGKPVGPGMNENKTVQLADGTLMLNSRAAPHRLVAYSHDGGASWSKPKPDPEQTDPGDNGSIIRYAPDAKASDPKSHWLLLSNNDDPSLRRNESVKMSCDDGKTWPISRVVDSGSSAYSTLTKLPNGKLGLLYERDGYRHITYASFGLEWLKGVCAPLSIEKPDAVTAGTRGSLTMTVTNQTQRTIRGGRVSLDTPDGWKSAPVHVRPLKPGASRAITGQYTPARTATGDQEVTARFTTGGKHSSATTSVPVTPDAGTPDAPRLSALMILDGMSAGGGAGMLDDVGAYVMRVTNTGNTKLADVTVTGNADNLAKCHYSSLKPGQTYNCSYASHAITAADVRSRGYRPRVRVTGTAPDGSVVHTRIAGEAIPISTR